MNCSVRVVSVAMAAALAIGLSGCGATTPIAPVSAAPVGDLQLRAPTADQAAALADFGQRLYNQVRVGQTNAVISPLSALTALGMAYDGAGGSTAQAFDAVLGLSAADARELLGYFLANLSAESAGTIVTSANSAWLDDTLQVKSDWVSRLQAYYQADVFTTDLQASGAVGQVNAWVSQRTAKLIPSMLDSIDPTAVALLINALYLKADWADQFSTNLTHQGTFTTADGRSVKAWYMSTEVETKRYFSTGDAEGIILPYQDGRLAFVAAMPASGDTTLAAGDIADWLAAARDTPVVLAMPKFHTEFGLDLADALKALGLADAFDPATADFSGIGQSPNGPLYISRVMQKVSMDVGEKGTVAAAATVVEVGAGAAPPPAQLVNLTFDRPYVYAIVDQVTGLPLFIGAMDDPSLAPPTAT